MLKFTVGDRVIKVGYRASVKEVIVGLIIGIGLATMIIFAGGILGL